MNDVLKNQALLERIVSARQKVHGSLDHVGLNDVRCLAQAVDLLSHAVNGAASDWDKELAQKLVGV